MYDVRDAIRHAYKIKRVGKMKFEIYTKKKGYKNLMVIRNNQRIVCVSGSQGGEFL